jgi:hypothetical protein
LFVSHLGGCAVQAAPAHSRKSFCEWAGGGCLWCKGVYRPQSGPFSKSGVFVTWTRSEPSAFAV